jgi:hypothetical protein
MAAKLTKAADGVHVGPLFPRNVFNTVVLEGPDGDVVVDAGPPWSGRRLARFLRGRDVVEHVVTHAHGDHVGSTAWLCDHTGAPLAMSEIEADDFEGGGSIAYHAGAGGRYLVAPMGRKRRPVDRRLKEGDVVAGLWCSRSRVTAQACWPCGARTTARWWSETAPSISPPTLPSRGGSVCPRGFTHDPEAAVASRWRLTRLKPDLIVSTHGYPVRGFERWTEGVRTVVH